MPANFENQAEEVIRSAGERVTSARIRILAMLLAEQRAITHHEIEEHLRVRAPVESCNALSRA